MLNPTLIRGAVAGAALALTLTACGSTATYDDDSTYEVEDCDADDMLEGDSDCAGYDGHSTKKHKATKPKKASKPTISKPRSSTKSRFGGGSSTRRR